MVVEGLLLTYVTNHVSNKVWFHTKTMNRAGRSHWDCTKKTGAWSQKNSLKSKCFTKIDASGFPDVCNATRVPVKLARIDSGGF